MKVDHTVEDDLIDRLINVATGHLDGRDGVLSRALITQTWDYTIDDFPAGSEIRLPLAPVQSITSITYTDPDGNSQTFSASDYFLAYHRGIGYVRLKALSSWPDTSDDPDAVTIRFVAGYGDNASDVPDPLRHAILLHLSTLFDYRSAIITGTIVSETPRGYASLIAPYIVRSP